MFDYINSHGKRFMVQASDCPWLSRKRFQSVIIDATRGFNERPKEEVERLHDLLAKKGGDPERTKDIKYELAQIFFENAARDFLILKKMKEERVKSIRMSLSACNEAGDRL